VIAELTIDLDALRNNVAALAALASPARYFAVVKADAYGHGLVRVALALAPHVAGFCVYRTGEAVRLRDAGIDRPLLILGPVETNELDAAVGAHAAIALWDDGAFRRDLARMARRHRTRGIVHAKIDTGVTRLGLDVSEAARIVATYLDDPALDVRGVFTHLAAAEELESGYTLEQLARFERALAPVATALAARRVDRHAAASAAAMLYPQLRLDLVRPGIATYGIWPSPQTRAAASEHLTLQPALRWTTRLVVVRDVPAGRSIGYGCTFVTQRPSRIGVLPIGYAEGLPRAVSNRGAAIAGGRIVPFVGRVCMNMSFVDVTDAPLAVRGTTVTLVGRDGEVEQDANALAAAAGSIGFELVARLPATIPRRYVEGARTAGDAKAASAAASSSVPS